MLRKHNHAESRELNDLAESFKCNKNCEVYNYFEKTMCEDCLKFWNRAAEIQNITTDELLAEFIMEVRSVN